MRTIVRRGPAIFAIGLAYLLIAVAAASAAEEPPAWREHHETVSALMDGIQANDKPLVVQNEEYDPQARIIHGAAVLHELRGPHLRPGRR
jgi:hypothetical protein